MSKTNQSFTPVTLTGVTLRMFFLLGVLIFFIVVTWEFFRITKKEDWGVYIMFGGLIAGLITGYITVLRKSWSPVTTPIFSMFQGAFLGAVTFYMAKQFPGVLEPALILEIALFFFMLITFNFGIIKPTNYFRYIVGITTTAIILTYITSMILGFWGIEVPIVFDHGLMGKIFSLFVIIFVSLLLIINFDLIADQIENKQPKFVNWFGAFTILVTLNWLSVECIRLVSKFYIIEIGV